MTDEPVRFREGQLVDIHPAGLGRLAPMGTVDHDDGGPVVMVAAIIPVPRSWVRPSDLSAPLPTAHDWEVPRAHDAD